MTTVSFENFSADQAFLRYDSPQWAEKCAQNWITFILTYKSFLREQLASVMLAQFSDEALQCASVRGNYHGPDF